MKNLFILAVILAGTAASQTYTAPNIYAALQYDSRTGANRSVVVVQADDAGANNALVIRCAGRGTFHVALKTSRKLMTMSDFMTDNRPAVLFRVDGLRAAVATARKAYLPGGEPDLNSLAFTPAAEDNLHQALINAHLLKVSVMRDGNEPLNYLFPAMGYIAAFNKVKQCR